MFFGIFWEHHTYLYVSHTLIIKHLNTILCYSEEKEEYQGNIEKSEKITSFILPKHQISKNIRTFAGNYNHISLMSKHKRGYKREYQT